MTSSNKVRRYLQHQKSPPAPPTPNTTTQYLVVDPSSSMATMRKFRGKTPPANTLSIPQICVDHNDDDNDTVKRNAVMRTLSLKPNEFDEHIPVPVNPARSFSFSLGSSSDVREKISDDDDDEDESSVSLASKTSSSRETFARLFHSLTFRSGLNSISKSSSSKLDSSSSSSPLSAHPCLACQTDPSNLDLISKTKKRPSIFGVLVAKLNVSSHQHDGSTDRCTVCKRLLVKSNSQQDQSSSTTLKLPIQEPIVRTKRRRSLPSIVQTLLESSNLPRRSSFFTENPHLQTKVSHSSNSLSESEESNGSVKRRTINGDEFNDKTPSKEETEYETNIDVTEKETSSDSPNDNSPNPFLLHPPEEKSRNLLINVFRTRRSHLSSSNHENQMTSKQFSASVINLASSITSHRRNSATIRDIDPSPPVQPRKHALSDESLSTMDNTCIYFTTAKGESFKENLQYSNIDENTSLREVLNKLFAKHQLSIETYDICLRSAPTLPLSLDQPVKHLLLDDLIVTESSCLRNVNRSSAAKEKSEKRYSTGSAAILSPPICKTGSKRLSTHGIMFDNEESPAESKSSNRTTKMTRSGLFNSGIFTRESSVIESDNHLSFIRRKCDEWLVHGLPKLAQLQFSIDDCDLIIEKEWQPFLTNEARVSMSEATKLQQEAIYEMLSTEVSYIRQILTMTDVFMTSVKILQSSERDGIFNDIDMEKLFSNIQDVIEGNLLFWKEILLPVKQKLEQIGTVMNPSDFKHGFLQFETYFKSYLQYVLDQKTSAEYFKQRCVRDELFQYLINWIEANFTNRLSFSDLTIKPLQRLTRYKLLLEAIQRKTLDLQQRLDLQEMIEKVARFVNQVNSKLDYQEQEERIRQINDRIGPFENIPAPPELTNILQEHYRDSTSNRLDLLQDMPLYIRGYRRQIIQQGPMKMKDAKNNQDVYCYLFSDLFLITKGGKRTGSTNSSSNFNPNSNENLSSRSSPIMMNKILKAPIRIDRLDVKEYDRRGGSSSSANEPNTASFVALVFSEYNLIECAYLFQTNLSKQWIENIRNTKANFQFVLEESKRKLQQTDQSLSTPISSSDQSLDSPTIKSEVILRRPSKVEQTRRNSRTDRKNFGRYFTADGTGTTSNHSTDEAAMLSSSSSSTITKRMSWNNERPTEKGDSLLITNSFRSVHSSSGVSSTGSFLFSTDEESSLSTTTPSTSSILPTTNENENPNTTPEETFPTISSSLRRTPFPSVKRRPPQQMNSRHLRLSSSARNSLEDNSSMNGCASNDSDYDNNLPAESSSTGEEQQVTHPSSDTPTKPIYQTDPLLTRRLIDIRSHLLLNTTLDATEV